jgi:formylglycine-generating enzyme required for sulfatase activity
LLEKYARVHENLALREDPDFSENVKWPVAGKKPNDFGLFDMLGNAFEWCGPNIGGETVTIETDLFMRGGAVCYPTFTFKADRDDTRKPDFQMSVNGFRVARTLGADTLKEP